MSGFIRMLSGRGSIALGIVGVAVTASAQSSRYVEVPGVKEFTGEMIVRPLQPDRLAKMGITGVAAQTKIARAISRVSNQVLRYIPETGEMVIQVARGSNENSTSAALMATGDYQYAEPNYRLYPARIPNDPQYGQQWHHPKVQSDRAWDLNTGSSLIISAVVDTGIDTTHPDLANIRVPGYNSVDRKSEIDGGDVTDINGHGTHVAGDSVAEGNNGRGVSGMGWNIRIMGIRTSNSPGGGASQADILDGARWAADNGARSISASYSGVGGQAIETTGQYIKGRNALFFYAAGNDARDLSGFQYQHTIVVGASNQGDTRAGFSAFGRGVNVFAPGVSILSTTNGGGYGFSDGTSMATPIANGLVALMFSANPTLTAQQAQNILYATCDNIGPRSIYGNGRINSFRAVSAAQAQLAREVMPNGIATTEGRWITGSVNDILNPNTGRYYEVQSVFRNGGFGAAEEVTFQTSSSSSTVLSLKLTAQVQAVPATLATAQIFAYNFSTGRYDYLGANPVSTNPTTQFSRSIQSNPGRYVDSSGQVKFVIRTFSNGTYFNRPPIQFSMRTSYARLSIASR
ncbi:MAG TPA: S8 family serine peptidase [Fimbriimonadaceae bacterium]|nr:S8 family serine peptidase [Fimbriimonadaceae bacterium]